MRTGTFLYPSQAQSLAAKMKTLSAEHQSCTKQLSSMESEAKKLTTAVAGLATAVASFSLSTYADFESQMSTVHSVSLGGACGCHFRWASVKALMSGSCDSTEELDTAMDSLTEKAQELGSTTAFTSTEVGEAMDTPNRVWILFEVRSVQR